MPALPRRRIRALARRQEFGNAQHDLMSVEIEYKRLAGFEAESLNTRPSWSVSAASSDQ
jgi:hypothetical protein